jgi:hypothetical protein
MYAVHVPFLQYAIIDDNLYSPILNVASTEENRARFRTPLFYYRITHGSYQ